MFGRLVHAVVRLSWPGIIVLLLAGAIAILLGLASWLDASTPRLVIHEYSGTVASATSNSNGTDITLRDPNGLRRDIFFDCGECPTLPAIRVGDRVTIWVFVDPSGFSDTLKLQSSRGTWVNTIYGSDVSLNPAPPPPYGPMAILAFGIGGALMVVALVGAYRLYTRATPGRRDEAAVRGVAAQPTEQAGQASGVLVGPERAAQTPIPRAGKLALVAVALGIAMWLAALLVSGACPLRLAAPLMLLAAIPAFALGAVSARTAASAQAVGPHGEGGEWTWLGVFAIVLTVASVIAVPVGLWLSVLSCMD